MGITPDKKDSFLKRIWRRLETIESTPSKEEIYELLDKVEERGFIDALSEAIALRKQAVGGHLRVAAPHGFGRG